MASNANKLKEILEKCSKAENEPLNAAYIERRELKSKLRDKFPFHTNNLENPKKKALSAYTQLKFEKQKNHTMQ